MCTLADYEHLDIAPWIWTLMGHELADWHNYYLPVRGTVLDVGAGCGETAFFYLQHGADHVIAIESDDTCYKMLAHNFKDDPRVTPIHAHIGKVKVDIEGAERGMDVESHFPYRWDVMREYENTIWQMRLVDTSAGVLHAPSPADRSTLNAFLAARSSGATPRP